MGKTRWISYGLLIDCDIFYFCHNVTGSKNSICSTKFVFLRLFGKQHGGPGYWLAETFSTTSLKLLNGISGNMTGSKNLMPSTKVGPIGKVKWPPWPLIDLTIFNFYSETVERNSPKLDKEHDLNALYQVFVCRVDCKNKMAAPVSDWLRYFLLPLWNRWMEFAKPLQKSKTQRPLPNVFLWPIGKQYGCPSLWLTETFWTIPLDPLNRIWDNLTRSKNSMSYFCADWKTNITALGNSSRFTQLPSSQATVFESVFYSLHTVAAWACLTSIAWIYYDLIRPIRWLPETTRPDTQRRSSSNEMTPFISRSV